MQTCFVQQPDEGVSEGRRGRDTGGEKGVREGVTWVAAVVNKELERALSTLGMMYGGRGPLALRAARITAISTNITINKIFKNNKQINK